MPCHPRTEQVETRDTPCTIGRCDRMKLRRLCALWIPIMCAIARKCSSGSSRNEESRHLLNHVSSSFARVGTMPII